MPKPLRPDPKTQVLRQEGTLNPHPERVRDPLFAADDFFDPRDRVQVKYEMLRRVRVEDQPLTRVCRAFGCSRPSFYKARADFAAGGLPGLIPARRGPRQAHKLTPEVLAFIAQVLGEDPALKAKALQAVIGQRFGLQVHPRTIERALARRQKKSS